MAEPLHVLIVEDEAPLRAVIAEQLTDRGFAVEQAENGETALERLSSFAFDILIADLHLPGIDGSTVVEKAVALYPDLIGIVVTGYGTVKAAVEAIKRGASDFITKPFQFESLMHVLNAALEQRRLKSENAYLRSQLQERYRFEGIIGRSGVMRDLFHLLETVAGTASTILITGETGTGKELVARAVHHNSPRRSQRFVAINCSAIPETLLEAELFGHVRGAFTGAVANRAGRIEQANRGTLFLDEIGTMSVALQMKLLRVLQEREFDRVGDSHPVRVDVRVIAATNSDLTKMVKEGSFREDLFYRLNVIPVHLPALRDRKEDIPLLVQHFRAKFFPDVAQSQRPAGPTPPQVTVSQQAMRKLMAYSWPGNVRQLENALERASALLGGRSQIEVVDLPPEIQEAQELAVAGDLSLPEGGIDFTALIQKIERDLISQALERTVGNKGQAARLLNLKRTTLVEKLKRFRADEAELA